MRPGFRTALGLIFALPLLGAVAAGTRVVLPTEWVLSPPQAQVAATGTLPESARLTGDGKHLIVVEGGDAGAGISVLDPQTLALETHVKLKGAFGDVAIEPGGDGYWVAGAGADALLHFTGAASVADRTIALPAGFWASAVALSPDGKLLAASGDQVDRVALVDVSAGNVLGTVQTGRHPSGLAFAHDGKALYVADWGENAVTAIDVAARSVKATIPVGRHPESLLLAPDGKRLFVSETDDDAVGVIDLASDRRINQPATGAATQRPYGMSPTAMALSRDGSKLFVAHSALNAIAVYRVGAGGLGPQIATIPTGWYPTAVTLDAPGTGLYVADGMGEGSRPNPQFAPFGMPQVWSGYDAASLIGSIRRIPIPSDDEIERAHRIPSVPIPSRIAQGEAMGREIVRAGGPIEHVIYIIKENRTFDQVLGDLPEADGDPKLAYFGVKITPNEHALTRRFGIFDNTYADAVVSADGHNWSMAAFANDYLEKMWPANYGRRRALYDFEDGADASVPHNGFIWDWLKGPNALRDYGEFVTNPSRKGGESTTEMPGLKGRIDPHFPGFDTDFRDEDREAEWAREFAGYVKRGDLPKLEIVRLPNDHTAGTRPGSRTPQAMVAENDLAFGRLVETVSHSRYWKNTAIFAIEDDAQNGPDHVDDQRTTFYLISPYAKGGVQHAHYSTAGVLRTIELLLGLPAMTYHDLAALPLYDAFTNRPDFRTYEAIPAQIDLEARNGATAYRAADSAKMDFSREDAANEADLNDILAHAR